MMNTPILSVSQLNRQIKNFLESDVGLVNVEGEVSNLAKPVSGHFYFTLKDSSAQLRCVFFRNRQRQVEGLKNGQQVVVSGILSLYEARGDYQLIVETLDEAGLGDLHKQFEILKNKLASLGLFEASRKKAIPRFPSCIGIITSASGAALHDLLTTLARRYIVANIIVYPSDVQGSLAAGQLQQAILRANREKRCDVLILARGGGSMEDLWAFNDEKLAYTIAESLIPIVSGVGHETDFTIADFVADLRAATPTAAAEVVTPNQAELYAYFERMKQKMTNMIQQIIAKYRLSLQHMLQIMDSPKKLIASHWQTLDYTERQLRQVFLHRLASVKHKLALLSMRLNAQNPSILLKEAQTNLVRLENMLHQAIGTFLYVLKQSLRTQMATLHAVSPLATLDRGYAIVTQNGRLLFDTKGLKINEQVDIRLARGKMICNVLELDK